VKALDEGREAFEITVLRDERDPLLAAGGGDQRVTEERGVVIEGLPPLFRGDTSESSPAVDEGGRGRREDGAAPLERLEDTSLQVG